LKRVRFIQPSKNAHHFLVCYTMKFVLVPPVEQAILFVRVYTRNMDFWFNWTIFPMCFLPRPFNFFASSLVVTSCTVNEILRPFFVVVVLRGLLFVVWSLRSTISEVSVTLIYKGCIRLCWLWLCEGSFCFVVGKVRVFSSPFPFLICPWFSTPKMIFWARTTLLTGVFAAIFHWNPRCLLRSISVLSRRLVSPLKVLWALRIYLTPSMLHRQCIFFGTVFMFFRFPATKDSVTQFSGIDG